MMGDLIFPENGECFCKNPALFDELFGTSYGAYPLLRFCKEYSEVQETGGVVAITAHLQTVVSILNTYIKQMGIKGCIIRYKYDLTPAGI